MTLDPPFGMAAPPAPAKWPPPLGFRPLLGRPQYVSRAVPTWQNTSGRTTAQKRGLRYESRVQTNLQQMFGARYHVGPLLHFRDGPHWRTLCPDGLLLPSNNRAFVFEIKIQHMPEAWWQLRQLYAPVVAELPGIEQTYVIEVCRSFDPEMGFPEQIVLIEDLESWVKDPPDEAAFGVHLCRV